MSDDVQTLLQRVVASLERVCPACLAATSQATWDALHRGKTCPNDPKRGRHR